MNNYEINEQVKEIETLWGAPKSAIYLAENEPMPEGYSFEDAKLYKQYDYGAYREYHVKVYDKFTIFVNGQTGAQFLFPKKNQQDAFTYAKNLSQREKGLIRLMGGY